MRTLQLLALLLPCTCFAMTVQASGPTHACPPYPDSNMHYDAGPIVDAIDRNHDGKMTHQEWRRAGAPEGSWNSFMGKGKNHPPYITRKEFLAETPPDGIDFNCDGKITIQEFRRFGKQGHPPPVGSMAPPSPR